ncbi:unnamed protein product [Aphanomyces euteiches]|uniref:Uncharacterized protein n=1 Tax=Aphanomyces euteiches TaxID=100861 RepID=A0A6G0WGD6_9STRA|nr:hypothetical protein Ae201684_015588 [Aphanomyces euteiches]KAH9084031.1 hypothetical protein Ae201684P_020293 [Aphanomyces euteiches]KAH9145264.1 hypothetical protein AeRB84_010822 [Aphanomyces euteiches]
MRLLFSIALATSAALALNQPRQDSPAILAHQEDYAVHYHRMLQGSREGKKFNGQEATGVSHESAIRRLKPKGNSWKNAFGPLVRAPSYGQGRGGGQQGQGRGGGQQGQGRGGGQQIQGYQPGHHTGAMARRSPPRRQQEPQRQDSFGSSRSVSSSGSSSLSRSSSAEFDRATS